MATSGAFTTSNKYINYRIEVTQNWQDTANNYSNVTVKVFVYRTNTGYTTYGSGTLYCGIDGTSYSQGITSSLASGSKILLTLLMYIGRVGPMTLIAIITNVKQEHESHIDYVEANVIIG